MADARAIKYTITDALVTSYGPTGYLDADSVLLTREGLAGIGAQPLRVGVYATISITLYTASGSTYTAVNLETVSATAALVVHDPVTGELKHEYTVGVKGTTNSIIIAGDDTTPGAGMWKFSFVVTSFSGNDFIASSGWIEFLPAVPTE